mgnify:CR=1 FL=1
MNDEDKNIIQTEEQYQKLRHYVLDYISRLLKKRHIVKKVKLREVYEDIKKYGYYSTKWNYSFLVTFLMNDKKHKNTNIDLLVGDFRRFKMNGGTSSSNNNNLTAFM